MPRAVQHVRMRRLACLALAGAVSGCAWWGPVEPPAPLEPLQVEYRVDAELDHAIAQAIPDVSYESQNPAMTEPLGPNDLTVILPRLETLDGDGRIVCRRTEQHVFGRCAFPQPGLAAP